MQQREPHTHKYMPWHTVVQQETRTRVYTRAHGQHKQNPRAPLHTYIRKQLQIKERPANSLPCGSPDSRPNTACVGVILVLDAVSQWVSGREG